MDPLFQLKQYEVRLSNHIDMYVKVRQKYNRPLGELKETGLMQPGGTQSGFHRSDYLFIL